MNGIWRGIALVACLSVGAPAMAANFDVVAGPSVTSGLRTTGAVFASAFGDKPSNDRYQFQPIGTVGWLAARHTRRERLHHQVYLAGGGVRVTPPRQHWFVSEQLAATSTRTDALSSGLEFMTSAGWQDGHFIIMLRHISNGRLIGHGQNLGETMLLAGVRW